MIVGIIMTAGTLLGELVPDFLMGLFTQTPSTVEIGRGAPDHQLGLSCQRFPSLLPARLRDLEWDLNL
mgnify:CR=1 FL=1